MKVVFFDMETTGTLVNKHGIHQLSGAIVVDGEDDNISIKVK